MSSPAYPPFVQKSFGLVSIFATGPSIQLPRRERVARRKLSKMWALLFVVLGVGIFTIAPVMTQAQDTGTFTTLHNFGGGPGGAFPGTGLVQGRDGNFYGTTAGFSDDSSNSTIYQITPASVFTTLYTFPPAPTDSSPYAPVYPSTLIQGIDGNFYGTTQYGGNGYGSVFEITPTGEFTTVYSFNDGSDGAYPFAALVQISDGNFYGTTQGDGQTSYGTVFTIDPAGVLTTLYTFSNGSDGSFPQSALVVDSDDNLYGTTTGDSETTFGTVFQITPTGELTTLYTFPPVDMGLIPNGLVLGRDGNFYGTTQGNGEDNYGSIYKISPTGIYTPLYTFTGGDGDTAGTFPLDALVLAGNGNFFGTTSHGGSTERGTIFEITPAGVLTTLNSFDSAGAGTDSAATLVIGTDGNLYGTTESGTASDGDDGTIFELAFSTNTTLPSSFFSGQVSLGNGVYYLSFSTGNYFGYYSYLTNPAYIYHFDLGYEYVFDAADGKNGVYFYDFTSGDFFYTSPTFPFPYLFDFTLNSTLYYYPDTTSAGHYTTNPRYFFNFATGQIITR